MGTEQALVALPREVFGDLLQPGEVTDHRLDAVERVVFAPCEDFNLEPGYLQAAVGHQVDIGLTLVHLFKSELENVELLHNRYAYEWDIGARRQGTPEQILVEFDVVLHFGLLNGLLIPLGHQGRHEVHHK